MGGAVVARDTCSLFIAHLYWKFAVLDGGLNKWWPIFANNGYPSITPWYCISAELVGAFCLIPGICARWAALYTLPLIAGAAQGGQKRPRRDRLARRMFRRANRDVADEHDGSGAADQSIRGAAFAYPTDCGFAASSRRSRASSASTPSRPASQTPSRAAYHPLANRRRHEPDRHRQGRRAAR
jgi:hypothetical protein